MKLIMEKEHFEQSTSAISWFIALIDSGSSVNRNKDEMLYELFEKGKFGEDSKFKNNNLNLSYNDKTNEVTIEANPEIIDALFSSASKHSRLLKMSLKSLFVGFESYITALIEFSSTLEEKISAIVNKRKEEKEAKENDRKTQEEIANSIKQAIDNDVDDVRPNLCD